MGYTSFSVFGANHAQFSLFAILIFVFTETLIMYFFIATGKSIKTILGEQNPANGKELWEEVKQIKKNNFPSDNANNIAYWRPIYILLWLYYL